MAGCLDQGSACGGALAPDPHVPVDIRAGGLGLLATGKSAKGGQEPERVGSARVGDGGDGGRGKQAEGSIPRQWLLCGVAVAAASPAASLQLTSWSAGPSGPNGGT
jgi:hypothetical protein